MPHGVYEPNTGPRDNNRYIYPMQGIYGYAASRVFIEIMGRRGKRGSFMILNALGILDDVLRAVGTSQVKEGSDESIRSEFIARLAEKGFHNGANPVDMLSHIFPQGILKEQNCFTDYRLLADDLKLHAPKVWKVYTSSPPDVLVQNGIVPLERIVPQQA